MPVVGDRVHEMKQHPRIAVHRAGNVAQHAQRRRPAAARAEPQRRQRPGSADAAAQRRAKVDRAAARRGDGPAHRRRRQRQLHPAQAAPDLGELLRGHRREILVLQHLARRKRERGVEIGLLLVAAFAGGARRRQHRLREARGQLVRGVAACARGPSAAAQRASSRAAAGCARRGRTPARRCAQMLAPRHEHGGERFAEVGRGWRCRRPRRRRARRSPSPARRAGPPRAARARSAGRCRRGVPALGRSALRRASHSRLATATRSCVTLALLRLAHELRRDVGRDRARRRPDT